MYVYIIYIYIYIYIYHIYIYIYIYISFIDERPKKQSHLIVKYLLIK